MVVPLNGTEAVRNEVGQQHVADAVHVLQHPAGPSEMAWNGRATDTVRCMRRPRTGGIGAPATPYIELHFEKGEHVVAVQDQGLPQHNGLQVLVQLAGTVLQGGLLPLDRG